MTSPDTSTPRPDLLARDEVAQVRDDEAKARKAEADAAMSELTLSQARYKALVPDLTGVATNVVTDKSVGVAFSGLVTHLALNHAAEDIANRIADVLRGRDQGRKPVILVTSQTDLLTGDLLSTTVKDCLDQLNKFANQLLTLTEPLQLEFENERRADSGLRVQDLARDLVERLAGLSAVVSGEDFRRRSRAGRRGRGRSPRGRPRAHSGWLPPRPRRFPRSFRCSPRPPRSRTTPKTSPT